MPLSVDPTELEARVVLCYTGEPRNSGTNNWEITKRHIDGDRHIFDCFERIRDTAAAMREALDRGDWDATAACLAEEWANRKRLAPGVTTPAIDGLIARALAAGAQAAKVCGAGGGGCLFCLAPPEHVAAVRDALAEGGARVMDFTHRGRRAAGGRRMSQELPAPLDNAAVARVLSEIADLLELKGENPFKIRAYRNGGRRRRPRRRARRGPGCGSAARAGPESARTSLRGFATSSPPATARCGMTCS